MVVIVVSVASALFLRGTLTSSAALSQAETRSGNSPTVVLASTTAVAVTSMPNQATKATLILAGGCFWCVEADLEKLLGITEVISGYAGGTTNNPTYETYHDGGHREVVQVHYDASLLTPEQIWIYALKHMDPTDGLGSFYDRGIYYSPAIYYKNISEKLAIEDLIAEIDDKGPYGKPLSVAVEPESTFYAAEEYHQNYYKGTLSQVKYKYYRSGSGRDAFISKYWNGDTGPTLPWREVSAPSQVITPVAVNPGAATAPPWMNYQKPDQATLKATLDTSAYSVTQTGGTEHAGTSPLDKNYERGIYVDILSGEPLFSSRDKFDSGTGRPSFVAPISPDSVTEHVDKKLFSTRTEIRSAIADNHLGHVFPDGPSVRGGLRYCMNGVALRFVPEAQMAATGYDSYKVYLIN